MLVLPPIAIPPFSTETASVADAVREWERGGAEVSAEAAQLTAAAAAARRGGADVAGEATGIGPNSSAVADGVGNAEPRAESDLAWTATQNIDGVSTAIGKAEQQSGDPRTNTPDANYGGAESRVTGKANSIENRGNQVKNERNAADEMERRI